MTLRKDAKKQADVDTLQKQLEGKRNEITRVEHKIKQEREKNSRERLTNSNKLEVKFWVENIVTTDFKCSAMNQK